MMEMTHPPPSPFLCVGTGLPVSLLARVLLSRMAAPGARDEGSARGAAHVHARPAARAADARRTRGAQAHAARGGEVSHAR
jgi:hypothetical protein